MFMATLRDHADNAGLSLAQLSRLANVDYQTARKAYEQRGPVRRLKALALVKVINEQLHLSLRLEDVDGLETL